VTWQDAAAAAQAHRQAGRLAEAITAYRAALAAPTAPPELHFNLGNTLFDAGRWVEAEAALAQAVIALPHLALARLQHARSLSRLGRQGEAMAGFSAVLAAEPGHFTANLEAGHALRHLGQAKQAMARYQAAAAAHPARWEPHLALARALEEGAATDAAACHLHIALGLAEAAGTPPRRLHALVAQHRLERGAAGAALEALRQAMLAARLETPPLAGEPWADLLTDLTDVLLRLGLLEPGREAMEEAATAGAALARLADIAMRHGLWPEATALLERNATLRPHDGAAHWALARLHYEAWRLEEAEAALAQAESLAPQAGATAMQAAIAARRGDAETALRLYLQRVEAGEQADASSAAMASLYCDSLSPEALAALHRRLFAPLGAPRILPRAPGRRPLRVGLVTPDLHHNHPVNLFMQPLLARWDQASLPNTVYCNGTTHDRQTALARSRAGAWVECAAWTDAQLATRIAADRIDILIDLTGHTLQHRMGLFAARAAPVQVTYLGYPGSTGVPNMDWIIADAVVAPEGAEALFSERIWRLPHSVFCYAPGEDYPEPAFTPDRPLTFGCFNTLPKLTPRSLRLWAALLAALPEARLLLKAPSFADPAARAAITARFASQGLDPARLECRGPSALPEMMAEYAEVDIALDPLPYNGGTTTLQAMWMGAPVLTQAGRSFVSRMGASFMQAAGLADWVARDDADYVAIGRRQATDRAALLDLKRGMRSRLRAAPAWDIDAFARDFQGGLRGIWQASA
jgi:predicted O-linked N-acetylglucosamine transferase (SPINDLY family)